MTVLIKNTTVLTMEDSGRILPHYNVRVEGNRIASLRPTRDHEDETGITVVDGTNRILMPGLINAHTHCAMSLFRNYGNDVALEDWLEKYIWPLEAHLGSGEARAGVRLNILEMLLSGTTCYVDMYYEMEDEARAVCDMGIRAVLSRGMSAPDDDGSRLREQRELYERWQGQAEGRISVMIGPHAVYTTNPNYLHTLKQLGDELHIGFHIHCAETQKEVADCKKYYGMSPVELFDSVGMLKEDTLAAHCVWLSEKDKQILAARKVNCVYNPASNMKLASGFMPVEDLQNRGITVCLGTDGASSNNRQDMFRDMMLGSLIQKGYRQDPKAVSARNMLRMAMVNGAKALGMEDCLGRVREGMLADLILVDFHNAHHCPQVEDIEAALVYSTAASDVCMTMVNGKILARDGRLEHFDAEEIYAQAQEAYETLMKKGGKA